MPHGHSSRPAAISPPRAVQPTRGSGVMNGSQGRGMYVGGTRVGPAPPRPGEFGWPQPRRRSSSSARAGTPGAEGGGAAAVVLAIIVIILLAAAHSGSKPAPPAATRAGAAIAGPATVAEVSSWRAEAPADRQARALRREGLRAVVLPSGSYRPFPPGLYIVCIGPFPETAAGRHGLHKALRLLPGSKAWRIMPRAATAHPPRHQASTISA